MSAKTVTMYSGGERVEVPQPMTTMFVGKALAQDEVVQPTDKRYIVLSKLAAHNGHPRTASATVLVRRPYRGVLR